MKQSKKILLILWVTTILMSIFGITTTFGLQIETNRQISSKESTWNHKPKTQNQIMQKLRIQTIQNLIENNFDHFKTIPFGPGSDQINLREPIISSEYPDFILHQKITKQDDLDILLEKKLQNMIPKHPIRYQTPNFENFELTTEEIDQLQKVYLFKNEQDLRDLDYVVSSYRTRTNNDQPGRQSNIMISYRNIGNTRVINPQQKISFMDEIFLEKKEYTKDLAYGRANIWGIVKVKGGGICGGARGIHTTILPNKAFKIIDKKNHTRTYKNLYQNTINGEESRIPGLDVAVYALAGAKKDFIFQNIRDYPVILVMNYDGTPGHEEEVFVLSKKKDRGYLKFLNKEKNCYHRENNGKQRKSCYGAILW